MMYMMDIHDVHDVHEALRYMSYMGQIMQMMYRDRCYVHDARHGKDANFYKKLFEAGPSQKVLPFGTRSNSLCECPSQNLTVPSRRFQIPDC